MLNRANALIDETGAKAYEPMMLRVRATASDEIGVASPHGLMMSLCWKNAKRGRRQWVLSILNTPVKQPCGGDDILGQLNQVFGFPHMRRGTGMPRSHNKFGAVPNAPGNYKALIEAYEYADLEVTER